ncbi:WD40 repeat-like protein, partial [Aureobasidium melanogenum]
EDGKVVVYDARRWDMPLAALACEMSCARSLHFTTSHRGGAALVVAESDDIVSVYDAMNWHDKQTIDFFGSVVGAASVEDGQELIVANGDETVGGLMVFERRPYIPDELDDFDYPTRAHHSSGQGLSFDDLMLTIYSEIRECLCTQSRSLSLLHAPSSFLFLAEPSETAHIATEELANVLEIFVDTSMGAFSIQT